MEFETYINTGEKYFDFYTGKRRMPLRTNDHAKSDVQKLTTTLKSDARK